MKIGEVVVTITSETASVSSESTDRPVEGGIITDNIIKNPNIINVSGVVVDGAYEALKKLREYVSKGTPVRYSGRNIFDNVIVQNIDSNHGYQVKGAFTFSCSLKQIRNVTSIELPFIAPTSAVSTTTGVKAPTPAKPKSAGQQVPKPSSTGAEYLEDRGNLVDFFEKYNIRKPKGGGGGSFDTGGGGGTF
jgi:hypothetical protein